MQVMTLSQMVVRKYPLARNQYISNSPGIFFLCSPRCEYMCRIYLHRNEFPPKYFYVLAPGMCEYRHYIDTEGRAKVRIRIFANTRFKNIFLYWHECDY